MKRIENDCCGCAVPGYPCLGKYCPLTHTPHYYCDECGEEIDPDCLYRVDDDDLCEECLKDTFKVDPDEVDYE